MAQTITSLRNARVSRLRKLEQRKYRHQERLFRAEGLQSLHMALEAGRHPVELFYCEELFAGEEAPWLLEGFRQAGAELVRLAPRVMESLSEREAPQGLIGVFPFFDVPLEEVRPQAKGLVLVLDRLQNPGNLGTLLRTADAVGAQAVVLLEPCVDAYHPEAVRGSMGSVFNVVVGRAQTAEALSTWLQRCGLRAVGADPSQGELWHRSRWQGGVALLLGNEARGLSQDLRPCIRSWVRLPMVGRAQSLNVAVAGGVLMYAWVQANAPPA